MFTAGEKLSLKSSSDSPAFLSPFTVGEKVSLSAFDDAKLDEKVEELIVTGEVCNRIVHHGL